MTPGGAAGGRFDVVGVGCNTLDEICVLARPPAPDAKETLRRYVRQPGGQIPTALVALRRWGLRTAYLGAFADDEGGEMQRRSLRAEDVDVGGCVERAGVESHRSIILVDELTGARTVLSHRPARLSLGAGELDRERIVSGRALLVDDDDVEAALRAAEWAKGAGALVMLDIDRPGPGIDALLERSDAVIVSREFCRRMPGPPEPRAAIRELRRRGPGLVAVTLGDGGALAGAGDGVHYVAPFRVLAADTTSAGDLFHAGALYGLLREWDVPRALSFAAAAAALECTKLGGRAAIPALDEVEALAERGLRSP